MGNSILACRDIIVLKWLDCLFLIISQWQSSVSPHRPDRTAIRTHRIEIISTLHAADWVRSHCRQGGLAIAKRYTSLLNVSTAEHRISHSRLQDHISIRNSKDNCNQRAKWWMDESSHSQHCDWSSSPALPSSLQSEQAASQPLQNVIN